MLSEKIKSFYLEQSKKCADTQSCLLALLHEIQKENGYISEDIICDISDMTALPYARIKAVATFYTMYNLKKTGKYHLQICRNLSCHMAKAKDLEKFINEYLGIKEKEITQDGLFSYVTVECLGACAGAPVLMVNETYHEKMDKEKFENLIEELKKKI